MVEVRKCRQLKPEGTFQTYKEATLARAQGNRSVVEVLRRWEIHSSDLIWITKTIEEGAIAQFKMNRSRKARVVYSEEEMLRRYGGGRHGPMKAPHGLLPEEREKFLKVARSEEYVNFSHWQYLNHYGDETNKKAGPSLVLPLVLKQSNIEFLCLPN